jgi:hypothetical protein
MEHSDDSYGSLKTVEMERFGPELMATHLTESENGKFQNRSLCPINFRRL